MGTVGPTCLKSALLIVLPSPTLEPNLWVGYSWFMSLKDLPSSLEMADAVG